MQLRRPVQKRTCVAHADMAIDAAEQWNFEVGDGMGGEPRFNNGVIVLLCHKHLARSDAGLAMLETLTRGGGLWVFKPAHAAANHGSPPMSRRLRRPLA